MLWVRTQNGAIRDGSELMPYTHPDASSHKATSRYLDGFTPGIDFLLCSVAFVMMVQATHFAGLNDLSFYGHLCSSRLRASLPRAR